MAHAERRLLAIGGVVSMLLTWAATSSAGDWLLYNPSPSMPPGLYRRTDEAVIRGAIVTVRARDVAPDYAALQGFTDPNDRFIKRVTGVIGDTVCADGRNITLNATPITTRELRDRAGRALPYWRGCRTLSEGQFFLLGDSADSFDGRYWGVVDHRQIEGVWRPLHVSDSARRSN